MLSSRRSRRVCIVINLAPRVYTDGATCNGHWMRAFPWTILISRTPRHGDAMDATEDSDGAWGVGEGRGADGDGSKCGRPPTSGMLKLGGYLTHETRVLSFYRYDTVCISANPAVIL